MICVLLGMYTNTELFQLCAPKKPSRSLTRAFTHLQNVIPDFTDNNLINIIRYGQDYYASSEVNYINQIDPNTLETIGRVS